MNEEYLRNFVSTRFSSQRFVCFPFVVSWKIPIGKSPEYIRSAEPLHEFGGSFLFLGWESQTIPGKYLSFKCIGWL